MGKKRKCVNANNRRPKAQKVCKSSKPNGKANQSVAAQSSKSAQPFIPFQPEDRILLVGEGDFSFSRSLLETHGCYKLHATSLDYRAEVLSKYPQSASTLELLETQEDCSVEHGIDVTRFGSGPSTHGGASKLIRRGGWDVIVFNFPHVGGLTTDVNRQVRANQEMLVAFFKGAAPLLAALGTIVVTLFDGEPYELWAIRNLARHVGLEVDRSFKFQSKAYPEYKHARTLGNIEGGGGWKGEDRPARSYIFRRHRSAEDAPSKKRKRPAASESDSESDND